MQVKTNVPAVNKTMNTLGEEALGLVVEPIFNGRLDLIIIDKSPSRQRFLEWIKDVVVTRREVRDVRGIF